MTCVVTGAKMIGSVLNVKRVSLPGIPEAKYEASPAF